MSKDIPPEGLLLAHARLSFNEPSVKWSIREMRKSPQIMKDLVRGFDWIIVEMNHLLGDDKINEDKYGAVERLKQQINKPLPTLLGLAVKISDKENPDVLQAIEETFSEIGSGLSAGGNWNWATKEMPLVMASALLIEGYGRMLAKHYGNEDIKRNFVIGFEETGFITMKDARIMQTVVKWMKEESADFSPEVREGLEKV